jgi:hypothetical protein
VWMHVGRQPAHAGDDHAVRSNPAAPSLPDGRQQCKDLN